MSQDPATETKIDESGLRYKSKVGGSLFGPQPSIYGSMNCFKCGQHKLRALGSMKRILNKSTFFCGDCRPVDVSK